MSGKLLAICHCEPSAAQLRGTDLARSNPSSLRLLRRVRNDKYLTGHDMKQAQKSPRLEIAIVKQYNFEYESL